MPSHTCMACSTAHAHPARLPSTTLLRWTSTDLQLVARFDADCSLRCELARKNMYIREDPSVKRGRYEAPYPGYSQPAPYAPSYQGQRASSYAPITNTRDNPPCNTLFIGNLSESVSEAELRTLFGSQPGFTQLKLNRGAGNITCFVEFVDLPTAMACHSGQQVRASCHSAAVAASARVFVHRPVQGVLRLCRASRLLRQLSLDLTGCCARVL